MSNFVGLDQATIEKLMGEGRTRNLYGPKLKQFMESDEAGINPAESWPLELGKKNASTLYQGFLTAAKNAGVQDDIRILQNDGSVFLLHKERAGILVNAESESTDEDTETTEDADEDTSTEVTEEA